MGKEVDLPDVRGPGARCAQVRQPGTVLQRDHGFLHATFAAVVPRRTMQLKIGFIGLGAISNENVLGYLDADDVRIVAVCDPNEDAAREWQQRWELPHATYYRDHEEMLAAEQFDIVEILTPHDLHCAHAVACAEANVGAVSLQKPMATTLQECDLVIAACRENGVQLKINSLVKTPIP